MMVMLVMMMMVMIRLMEIVVDVCSTSKCKYKGDLFV